jgi:hypothetical protein
MFKMYAVILYLITKNYFCSSSYLKFFTFGLYFLIVILKILTRFNLISEVENRAYSQQLIMDKKKKHNSL